MRHTMHKERFYVKVKDLDIPTIALEESEHRHLAHVMRIRVGEEVDIVNGLGSIAAAEVLKIEKDKTTLKILSVQKSPKPTTCIQLGIPLMRSSKLEWIVEKGTELGADAFFLYPAEKSKQEDLSEHQFERLSNIAISALKQSKRLYLPPIEKVSSLEELCRKENNVFFGDVNPTALSDFSFPTSTLFITGPESGFSLDEISFLEKKGVGIHMNPNVLRAETAPIAALSILAWEMGKLK